MLLLAAVLATLLSPNDPLEARPAACATAPDGPYDQLALHGYWSKRGTVSTAAGPQDVVEDGIAILEDRGDLVARKNPLDLSGRTVRFTANARGGYDAGPGEPIPSGVATDLDLAREHVLEIALPFRFPFFGRWHDRVFVHFDGHLTFGEPDLAGGARSMARFLGGPPRIAVFFADLDLARGGRVTTEPSAGGFVVRWTDVPGGGQFGHNTFGVALRPSGEIDLAFGQLGTRNALVGVSPGEASDLTPADLTATTPVGGAGALVERFSERDEIDLVSCVRRVLGAHGDGFDQVVVYTTRPLNPYPGTLAFEINVKNDVAGIGLESFDFARDWGSAGRLTSVVYMDAVDTYLDVDGFEVLAHEVGHRWLANARFRTPSGEVSRALLGDGVHWSFFFDTDGSFLGGNDLEEISTGRFETVDFARRYGPLDQYLMGLRSQREVSSFFLVEQADDFRPNRPYKPSSGSETGVSFTGVKREVRVEDVIAALGPRVPDSTRSPRVFRQAFVLVADAEGPATPVRRSALKRIRSGFETFFLQATEGRAAVETALP